MLLDLGDSTARRGEQKLAASGPYPGDDPSLYLGQGLSYRKRRIGALRPSKNLVRSMHNRNAIGDAISDHLLNALENEQGFPGRIFPGWFQVLRAQVKDDVSYTILN